MGLAKQCDTRDRLSAGRSRSQHSFRPVSYTDRPSPSAIGVDEVAKRQSFAEDFLLEHTNSSLRFSSIGKAGKSGIAPREQQKSAQCYGFPS